MTAIEASSRAPRDIVERLHVDGVEALANAEQEDADDDEGDQTEKATLISTTSGMPLAPVAARMRPFSSDMKPTTWLTALRRVTIISRPSSTTDSANARSSRASGSAPPSPQHDHHRERNEAHADQHGRADADDRLDLAVDAEAHDDALQRHRNDDRLEYERDQRGDVEMRRILDVGLPGDGRAPAPRACRAKTLSSAYSRS